jgi:hypothetical protein
MSNSFAKDVTLPPFIATLSFYVCLFAGQRTLAFVAVKKMKASFFTRKTVQDGAQPFSFDAAARLIRRTSNDPGA